MSLSAPEWLGQEPWEDTPRFYESRPCPDCLSIDSARPRRKSATEIRARCAVCGRAGQLKATWREALADFFGPLPGRSPAHGRKVGDRFRVKECAPPVYPLKGLSPGDVVMALDYETGAYTVERESDGQEALIASQNVGEWLPRIIRDPPPARPKRAGAPRPRA